MGWREGLAADLTPVIESKLCAPACLCDMQLPLLHAMAPFGSLSGPSKLLCAGCLTCPMPGKNGAGYQRADFDIDFLILTF